MLASLANASARAGPASLGRSADTTAPSRIICAEASSNRAVRVSAARGGRNDSSDASGGLEHLGEE